MEELIHLLSPQTHNLMIKDVVVRDAGYYREADLKDSSQESSPICFCETTDHEILARIYGETVRLSDCPKRDLV